MLVDVCFDTVDDRLPQVLSIGWSNSHVTLGVCACDIYRVSIPYVLIGIMHAARDLCLHRAIAVRASDVVEVKQPSVV